MGCNTFRDGSRQKSKNIASSHVRSGSVRALRLMVGRDFCSGANIRGSVCRKVRVGSFLTTVLIYVIGMIFLILLPPRSQVYSMRSCRCRVLHPSTILRSAVGEASRNYI